MILLTASARFFFIMSVGFATVLIPFRLRPLRGRVNLEYERVTCLSRLNPDSAPVFFDNEPIYIRIISDIPNLLIDGKVTTGEGAVWQGTQPQREPGRGGRGRRGGPGGGAR